jgi:hypothetical protein
MSYTCDSADRIFGILMSLCGVVVSEGKLEEMEQE